MPGKVAAAEPVLPGAWRALPILIMLNALALLDRQVLTLMVEPVKRDLGLSDFQIGLLQGIAFSVFYGVAALPIGWAVDRYSRRPIIWLGVTFWGAAAAACGLAQNFWQLFLARLGVGIGEASLSPAAYSMLADLFPPARLALALSILLVGATLGNGLSVGLGGAIVELAETGRAYQLPLIGPVASWQFVFLVTGLPGLVLGALIFLVREPKRRDRLGVAHPPLAETVRFVKARRAFFTAHFVGFCLLAIMGWGITSWIPAYMSRTFAWSIGQLSLPLAFVLGIGGTLGTLVTGWAVDRLFRAGFTDAHMRVYVFIALGMAAFGVAAFQVSNPWVFLVLVTPIVATMALAATAGAALQIVTPNEMRGQVAAMFLLVINGVGLGFGPAIIGALTDFVFQDEARLGSSIAILFSVAGPIAAAILALGLRPMRDSVLLANAWRTPAGSAAA